MFGLKILDFILSLCFIFFLSSLLASWIYELISILLKRRSVNLRNVLNSMIGGEADKDKEVDLLERLYQHPLIKEHTKKRKNPEYIPDKEFGFVILDILKNIKEKDPGNTGEAEKEKKIDIEFLKAKVEQIRNPFVRDKLSLFIDAARAVDGDINTKISSIQKRLEDWFDNMMKRATDLYKRFASIIMFLIGLGIAGILNIDSFHLVNSLWYDSKLNETISDIAAKYIEDSIADGTEKEKKEMDIYKELDTLRLLPVGWNTYIFPESGDFWAKTLSILLKIIGIVISALAISQGGPFWYDLLVKLTRLKKTS